MEVKIGSPKVMSRLEVGDKYDCSVVNFFKFVGCGQYVVEKKTDGTYTIASLEKVEKNGRKTKKTPGPTGQKEPKANETGKSGSKSGDGRKSTGGRKSSRRGFGKN